MKRSRVIFVIGLVWLYSSLTCSVTAADQDIAVRSLPDSIFKLRAIINQQIPDDCMVLEGWKRPAKVDSNLVDRISKVRLSLPAWHGLHTLTPGTSGN